MTHELKSWKTAWAGNTFLPLSEKFPVAACPLRSLARSLKRRFLCHKHGAGVDRSTREGRGARIARFLARACYCGLNIAVQCMLLLCLVSDNTSSMKNKILQADQTTARFRTYFWSTQLLYVAKPSPPCFSPSYLRLPSSKA